MINPILSNPEPKPVHTLLSGETAFHRQKRSIEDEFSGPPIQADYLACVDSNLYRFVKALFAYTISLPFTVGHYLLGRAIVQSSNLTQFFGHQNLEEARFGTVEELQEIGYETKRLSIDVDGYRIDAQIIGKPKNLDNGKWTLFCPGNAQFANENLPGTLKFLDNTENNLITFNYPSVAHSSGCPSREGCVKAAQGVLQMLEDKEKGIGAKEITLWGLSLGGGIVSEALENHEKKDGISYVAIKDRTFSELATEGYSLFYNLFRTHGFNEVLSKVIANITWIAIKVFAWNIDSTASVRNKNYNEFVLQNTYNDLAPVEEILDTDQLKETDNVITKEASLAYRLKTSNFATEENNPRELQPPKLLGITQNHNARLSDNVLNYLSDAVKDSHSSQNAEKVHLVDALVSG